MHLLDRILAYVKHAWGWILVRCASLSRRTLAWSGIGLAAAILLSINLISSIVLRNWQADLTQDRLFTISQGTREVLQGIKEPITARLYYSRKLGEAVPRYAGYFDRVRALLEQYRDISDRKLQLTILDPEPFSQAEDRAVAAGLSGVRLNPEGEVGYFGLVASNATDNEETIAFFSPDRESFLEYDVTKLIYTLSNPKKRVVGLMAGVPMDGGMSPMGRQPLRPWLIMDQVREFFDVRTIEQTATSIPKDVDVLLVAQPTELTPQAAYAIDQYALNGGKVLVFADPAPEVAQLAMLGKTGSGMTELAKLLKAWGVGFDPAQAAADIAHARRVQFGGQRSMVTDHVAWLGLDRSNIDQRDVLSAGIDTLNLASPGVLTRLDGATTTVTPIVQTSNQAMVVDAKGMGFGGDPVALLRNYKPGGKPLTLAVRLSGTANSAFPDGAPKAEASKEAASKPEDTHVPSPDGKTVAPETAADEKDAAHSKPAGAHVASGRINAIVVADTDLLADEFWVEKRELLGQQVVIPTSHNAALVVGALENLSGSDALIALRGRGVKERPFTWVESLRRAAEQRYREKEQALTQRLKTAQGELAKLQTTGQGGAVILSEEDRQAIEKVRNEILETRRELRDVKLALRRDIDRLDGWLKFANIALVPIAIGFGGLGWSLWHARRRKRKPA